MSNSLSTKERCQIIVTFHLFFYLKIINFKKHTKKKKTKSTGTLINTSIVHRVAIPSKSSLFDGDASPFTPRR